LRLGEEFFQGNLTTIRYLTEADIRATWNVFHRFSDKGWSFTDCSSKVIIEKLNITSAFAFDHHFQQFGIIAVAP